MLSLAEAFAALEDPRRPNARHHPLLDILVIAFCASLCGAESCGEMAGFALSKEEVLREFLALEGGPPARARHLQPGLPDARSGAFCRLLSGVSGLLGGGLPRTWGPGRQDLTRRPRPGRRSLAAAEGQRLCLGNPADLGADRRRGPAQRDSRCPGLLHTQRETAQVLRDQGADYILTLKGNQGTLYEDVRTLLDDPGLAVQDRAQTLDADQGRSETRKAHLVTDWAWWQEQHEWPGRACLGQITATREDTATGTVQTQDRYYLLSRVRSAREFLELGRAHGTIENSLPWVLDVILHEDHARARKEHAPAHLALLRRMALKAIKANQDKGSTRLKLKRAGWDDCFLRKLMAQC